MKLCRDEDRVDDLRHDRLLVADHAGEQRTAGDRGARGGSGASRPSRSDECGRGLRTESCSERAERLGQLGHHEPHGTTVRILPAKPGTGNREWRTATAGKGVGMRKGSGMSRFVVTRTIPANSRTVDKLRCVASARSVDYRDLLASAEGDRSRAGVRDVCEELPRQASSLATQIRRAANAVHANIAEGNGRFSRPDYLRHLSIANGSLRELESDLHFADAQIRAESVPQHRAGALHGRGKAAGRARARLAREERE